jgi:DNA-binding GntR family transcriptional regulator
MDHDRLHYPGSPFGLEDPAGRLALDYQAEQVLPPPHIAQRLGLRAAGDPVMRTRYLLSVNGAAIQLATSYEPVQITRGTAVAVPEQGPFAGRGVIERMKFIGICVDEVTEEISVRPALRNEATVLAIGPGAPVLLVQRTHLAAGTAVEAGDIVLAADGFRLRYRIPV